MANHNSDPKYTYQGRKFPHDLSHNLKFTSSVGQLIPVLSDFLLPGDSVRIGANLFTRMADLETAAFTRMREHIEYFFVPIQHIISTFPQFIYGVGNNKSSLFIDPVTQQQTIGIPSFNPTAAYSTDISGVDLHAQSSMGDAIRLLDMLEYSGDPKTNILDATGIGANTLRICAYHKIFYDCYSIADRTPHEAQYYNLDDDVKAGNQYISLAPGNPQVLTASRNVSKFFHLHYRPFAHDYYTDAKVSPLESASSVNANSNLNGRINNWLGSNSVFTATNPSGSTGADDRSTVSYYDTTSNITAKNFSTANIRSMFAVEKLLEITRRSKKDYAHQTLAHFGSKVPEGISGLTYKLGSVTQLLTIQDVDSTTNGAVYDGTGVVNTNFLGQQGGKGVTDQPNNKVISFTAPCHGILMAIYSCEPITDYPDTMVSRQNTYLNREDFYTPEYDHLGMQPIFGYEMVASYSGTRTSVFGWQYRYQELKQRFNRVTSGFNTVGLSAWNTVRNPQQFGNNESSFYISPTYLNPIMLVNYDNNDMGTDPLRHSLDFFYSKSSVMSNYSLPQLSGNA